MNYYSHWRSRIENNEKRDVEHDFKYRYFSGKPIQVDGDGHCGYRAAAYSYVVNGGIEDLYNDDKNNIPNLERDDIKKAIYSCVKGGYDMNPNKKTMTETDYERYRNELMRDKQQLNDILHKDIARDLPCTHLRKLMADYEYVYSQAIYQDSSENKKSLKNKYFGANADERWYERTDSSEVFGYLTCSSVLNLNNNAEGYLNMPMPEWLIKNKETKNRCKILRDENNKNIKPNFYAILHYNGINHFTPRLLTDEAKKALNNKVYQGRRYESKFDFSLDENNIIKIRNAEVQKKQGNQSNDKVQKNQGNQKKDLVDLIEPTGNDKVENDRLSESTDTESNGPNNILEMKTLNDYLHYPNQKVIYLQIPPTYNSDHKYKFIKALGTKPEKNEYKYIQAKDRIYQITGFSKQNVSDEDYIQVDLNDKFGVDVTSREPFEVKLFTEDPSKTRLSEQEKQQHKPQKPSQQEEQMKWSNVYDLCPDI